MKKSSLLLLLTSLIMGACTSTQISSALKTATDILVDSPKLTTLDVTNGLKEALVKGAEYSTDLASKTDGYYKNPALKIPFPPAIKSLQPQRNRLRRLSCPKTAIFLEYENKDTNR